eukprot:GHUV01034091.1.p1 GENE.GHUV01034091.1~~GHUV01034091.1.p1  ORF type:complete len:118 (+),score=22.25 GHUV01034091.1:1056-1409(+)
MEAAVQQIVSGDGAAAEAGTTAVLNALRDGTLSVLGLVALLKRPLTDEQDHEERARAVHLLSRVVADAPATLQSGDVSVMADFLSAKLQDWWESRLYLILTWTLLPKLHEDLDPSLY